MKIQSKMENKELFGITNEDVSKDLIRTYKMITEVKDMFLTCGFNEAKATIEFTLERTDKDHARIKEFTNVKIERETEVLKQKQKSK